MDAIQVVQLFWRIHSVQEGVIQRKMSALIAEMVKGLRVQLKHVMRELLTPQEREQAVHQTANQFKQVLIAMEGRVPQLMFALSVGMDFEYQGQLKFVMRDLLIRPDLVLDVLQIVSQFYPVPIVTEDLLHLQTFVQSAEMALECQGH